MKIHPCLLLLAILPSIEACDSCNTEPEEYPPQMYGHIGYPSYPSSEAPVSQAGYFTPGGFYDTHLSPATSYPVYQKSSSYYQEPMPTTYVYAESSSSEKGSYPTIVQYSSSENSYNIYPPQPTPVGTPPTPGYYGMTTVAYLSPMSNRSYATSTSTAYVTTGQYTSLSSSVPSSPASVTLPIQISSASRRKEVTLASWAWGVAIGGVGMCLGLHFQF